MARAAFENLGMYITVYLNLTIYKVGVVILKK